MAQLQYINSFMQRVKIKAQKRKNNINTVINKNISHNNLLHRYIILQTNSTPISRRRVKTRSAENTEKSPGDLKRLAVTRTPVENH